MPPVRPGPRAAAATPSDRLRRMPLRKGARSRSYDAIPGLARLTPARPWMLVLLATRSAHHGLSCRGLDETWNYSRAADDFNQAVFGRTVGIPCCGSSWGEAGP